MFEKANILTNLNSQKTYLIVMKTPCFLAISFGQTLPTSETAAQLFIGLLLLQSYFLPSKVVKFIRKPSHHLLLLVPSDVNWAKEMNLLHLPWHVNQINHMDDLEWNELNMIQTFCGKKWVLCRTTSTRHLLSKHEQVICWVLNKLTTARQGCTILIWNTSSISAAVVTV